MEKENTEKTDIVEVVQQVLDTYNLSESAKSKLIDQMLREFPVETTQMISQIAVKKKLQNGLKEPEKKKVEPDPALKHNKKIYDELFKRAIKSWDYNDYDDPKPGY